MIDLTGEIQSCRARKTLPDSLTIYRLYVAVLSSLLDDTLSKSEELQSQFKELILSFVPFLAAFFPSVSFDEDDPSLLKNTIFSNVLSSLFLFRKFESADKKSPVLLVDCLKRLFCAKRMLSEG